MVRSIFALAAVLSVASVSLAGDLATPPMYVGASSTAECRLTNITSAPIPAQFELIDFGGSVLTDSGSITVLAGSTASIVRDSPATPVYCRFVHASRSKVRADMTIVGTGDGTDRVVVAAQ
jgi:hypothetical protein